MRIMSDEAPIFYGNDAIRVVHLIPTRAAKSKRLRLGVLFSGGKDSAYAAYLAQHLYGHEIVCMVSLFGHSEESMLLHHPNIRWTRLQAEAMCGMPLISGSVPSDDTQKELDALESLLKEAKSKYGIHGVVHGGIKSSFQHERYARVAALLDLDVLAPLWNSHNGSAASYMKDVIGHGFEFVITAVSAGGLDDSWLGRQVTPEALGVLDTLSRRHGFALDFEGGEAETFVLNCPMFSHRITILDSKTVWDGYRGRFEILDAVLERNA